MITNSADYYSLLYKIQNANRQDEIIKLPDDEPIYEIDLNTRIVKGPEFLGAKMDHMAEVIYFCVDRYYDHIDLFNTTCVVQYTNAAGEGRMYRVPYYDIKTKGQDKIVFPWYVGYEATKKEGTVNYNIQFYSVDTDTKLFTYNLQTLPTSSKVLYTFSNAQEEEYIYEPTEFERIEAEIDSLKKDWDLFWIKLD